MTAGGADPGHLRFAVWRGLRRALVAYGLFDLVEFSIWFAILLWAYAEGGPSLAGLVSVIQLLPALVLVPLLAGIGDRMPRGRALALAHAGVAGAVGLTGGLLLVAAPAPAIICGGAASTTAVALVRPIHFATLPQLARSSRALVSANALSSGLDAAGLFAGPVLAGIVVQLVGPWAVFAAAAGAATTACALTSGLDVARRAPPRAQSGPSAARGALDGLRALSGDWGALALLLVMGTRFVVEGALDVLGVAFSESVLLSGASTAGLVIGSVGIGALVGAAVSTGFAARRQLTPVVLAGALVLGLGVASVPLLGRLAPVMIVLAAAGVGASLLMVAGRTLLQRSTDDRVLARVFAVQEGVSLLGLAIGAGLAPLLISRLSPAAAFIPLGLGVALMALGAAGVMRALDNRATLRVPEVTLLRRNPTLSLLPEYEIERLALGATWLQASPGDVVLAAWQTCDALYIIAEGEFTRATSGVPGDELLTAGSAFGDLPIPDMAANETTVTARTAGQVLVVRAPQGP